VYTTGSSFSPLLNLAQKTVEWPMTTNFDKVSVIGAPHKALADGSYPSPEEVLMMSQCSSKSKAALAAMLLISAAMAAQDKTPPAQANPTPGCSAKPEQIEANRKLVLDFFRLSGEARIALLDPAYKQHNPVAVRRAQQEHLSDYEEARNGFLAQATGPVHGLGLGPTPPGNRFEIVTAECDIVTVTFDSFRVKGGKLVEHWDGASISAPEPTPAKP
jgi:hypothetical protein